MKVFCLEGVEFYAAKNWRDAVRAANEYCGYSFRELLRMNWQEITAADLETKWIFSDDVDDIDAETRPFADQVQRHIDAGDRFPLCLASTDY